MSRRSDTNAYAGVGRHEADRNIAGLIGDLSSEQALIRSHVCRALAALGAKEAAPHVAKLADDPVKTVRMSALMALGKLRAEGFTDVLLRGLDDPVPIVRMGAADGLRDLGDVSAIRRLHEVLRTDGDREVRFCVAEALVTLGDKEVLPDLPRVLRESPWRTRFNSRWKALKQVADSQGQ